ncbi:MAG: family 16 glycoside hydrolase, partial [Alistipes sp.]|nr:family 16 glycoside hydrolase [Alistipes sp.]
MKKFISILAAVAIVATSATSCQKPNTLTAAEEAEGWQLLFDGETLNGWRSFNEKELKGGWTVVDGCIQASGEGGDASGYIVTDKKYANFELVWDWKLTKGGNSGMLYHVVEHPRFSVPYVTGPEYQLIDVEGWEEK